MRTENDKFRAAFRKYEEEIGPVSEVIGPQYPQLTTELLREAIREGKPISPYPDTDVLKDY